MNHKNTEKTFLYTNKKPVIFALLILIFTSTTLPQSVTGSNEESSTRATVTISGRNIFVETAVSEEEKKEGLMWRTHLARDEGMLFVYKESAIRHFWMKNTFIHLDIAFIDRDMVIRSIASTSKIQDSTIVYRSPCPVKYVLEVNRGWFEENGAGVGDTVAIEPRSLRPPVE